MISAVSKFMLANYKEWKEHVLIIDAECQHQAQEVAHGAGPFNRPATKKANTAGSSFRSSGSKPTGSTSLSSNTTAPTKTMTEEPKTQVPLKRAEQGERCPKVTVEEVPNEEDNTSFLQSHAEPPKAKPVVLPAKPREEHLALLSEVCKALVQPGNPMVNKSRWIKPWTAEWILQSIHEALTLEEKIVKLKVWTHPCCQIEVDKETTLLFAQPSKSSNCLDLQLE
ncbi:uncharacterized protein BT62DRAFT_923627 [Guyanagaster necrorhizus]|uniref:Uncharacterized protein n=1 Tax=Guyanagaster necrorhizus TaxID=856835 RepID=A0A9P7VI64_9AGAR|nr:uncharacterized protein BT62DRAFT_923627 [Guyanagaster necrorhizus MCA 3950]KAG7441062.1 hypothetical protein BT62DRAFT_923627 [Guyanagaster necrorhizus MCA 3950]